MGAGGPTPCKISVCAFVLLFLLIHTRMCPQTYVRQLSDPLVPADKYDAFMELAGVSRLSCVSRMVHVGVWVCIRKQWCARVCERMRG